MKILRSPQPDSDGGGGGGGGTHDNESNDKESSENESNDNSRRRELIRYAGLSTQVVVSIGVSVFLGMKADKGLKVSFPILSWALPLLVIVVLLVNLIKSGSSKKNGK
jgi:hypothetical protein